MGEHFVASVLALTSGALGPDLPRQGCSQSRRFCASLLLSRQN